MLNAHLACCLSVLCLFLLLLLLGPFAAGRALLFVRCPFAAGRALLLLFLLLLLLLFSALGKMPSAPYICRRRLPECYPNAWAPLSEAALGRRTGHGDHRANFAEQFSVWS